jgi:hypothetical protein
MWKIKHLGSAILIGVASSLLLWAPPSYGGVKPTPKRTPKVKFYNFTEQLIDGQRLRPSLTYVDHRQKAKFKRLLSLKKSFLSRLFATGREKVFR